MVDDAVSDQKIDDDTDKDKLSFIDKIKLVREKLSDDLPVEPKPTEIKKRTSILGKRSQSSETAKSRQKLPMGDGLRYECELRRVEALGLHVGKYYKRPRLVMKSYELSNQDFNHLPSTIPPETAAFGRGSVSSASQLPSIPTEILLSLNQSIRSLAIVNQSADWFAGAAGVIAKELLVRLEDDSEEIDPDSILLPLRGLVGLLESASRCTEDRMPQESYQLFIT